MPPLAGASLVPDHDVSGPQDVVAVFVRAVAVPASGLIVKPEIHVFFKNVPFTASFSLFSSFLQTVNK